MTRNQWLLMGAVLLGLAAVASSVAAEDGRPRTEPRTRIATKNNRPVTTSGLQQEEIP